MARAARTCSRCPTIITSGTRCTACTAASDKQRRTGTPSYGTRAHQRFRAAVLARDPQCVIPHCWQWATVADHHPRSRRDLIAAGQDPNDPRHGRGLCKHHHDVETAKHQPGGWNAERIAGEGGG